ncbi:MAG: radical SAM protein [Chitinophagaceae bacterium]|nr:radical SAM protein [Chitinophagaceae bacterium]
MVRKLLLLIIPPQKGLLKGFATGIVSLAEYLSQKKAESFVDVQIIDYSQDTPEEVFIDSLKYAGVENLVVGVTTTTASYQSAIDVAKSYKQNIPSCNVIFGGHHASADPETVLRNNIGIVDYIIAGEGEVALYNFLHDFPQVRNTPNLIYIDKSDIIKNTHAPLLSQEDLDLIMLGYKERKLYGHAGKFDTITYVSARGCPLQCSFCAVANQKMRTKSTKKVCEDISQILDLGFNTIAIEDNFFAHSHVRTMELCSSLSEVRKSYPSFRWDCQTRVESLKNPDIIMAMERAGCYAVYLGVEALNYDHLIYLGKSKTPDRYLELLSDLVIPNLLKSSVNCFINIQFGIPGSNSQHDSQTISTLAAIGKRAASMRKKVTVFPMLHVIYPGTKHYFDGVTVGYFSKDVFERFTQWEASQISLYNWMGDNFAHGTGGIPQGILNKEKLREGKFEIITDKVLEIQNLLSKVKYMEGISLFEYKPFIN